MSSRADRIENEAHHFLEEARHRNDFNKEFDAMPLQEQLSVTRAMRRQESNDEKAHPDLPKVAIECFPSGYLKEVDAPRAWYDPRSGAKVVYKQDHDPAPPSNLPGALKSILHGVGEALQLKRKLERKLADELLKQ